MKAFSTKLTPFLAKDSTTCAGGSKTLAAMTETTRAAYYSARLAASL
jgi:hypothetical protein